MSADQTPETANSDSVATLSHENQAAGASGDGCTNCGSTADWGHSSWCPRCGWYPQLNTCVEVDPPEEEMQEEKPLEWWEVVPMWAWILGFGEVGLIVLSIFARMTTSINTGARPRWALTQLFIGFCVFAVGQAWAFLYAVTKSADFSPVDLITKPFAIWGPSNRLLPKSFPRLGMAVWGLTAMLLAVLVIGGINYNAMFEDWGFEEQAQPNLIQEIVKKAKENDGDGEESLEDAINSFAGEEDPTADADEDEEQQVQLDCLIVGYTGNTADEFTGLVLAALIKGKLQYVGTVFEGIPDEERKALAKRMKSLKRDRPFVKAKVSAQWLEPFLMCRVTGVSLSKKNILKKPLFKERLADAK